MTRRTTLRSVLARSLTTLAVVGLAGCSTSTAPAQEASSQHQVEVPKLQRAHTETNAPRGAEVTLAEHEALEKVKHLAEETLAERVAIEEEAKRKVQAEAARLAKEASTAREVKITELKAELIASQEEALRAMEEVQ